MMVVVEAFGNSSGGKGDRGSGSGRGGGGSKGGGGGRAVQLS